MIDSNHKRQLKINNIDNDLVVVWRITELCNLGCSFCAYDKNLAKSRVTANSSVIRNFLPLLADFSQQTGRSVLISWLGGEPFLWSELKSLTEHAKMLGLRVSTTTNGTPLGSAELRKHILKNYSELTFSIDGIGETHNELRKWNGGFQKLESFIKCLQSERQSQDSLILRANIVLMRKNIKQFPSLCRTLVDWGISVITFNQLGGRDRPEFYPDNRLIEDDVAWMIKNFTALKQELAERNVQLLGSDSYLNRFLATIAGQKLNITDCSPGKRFLFIDENGIAAPCSFTGSDYGVNINTLKTVDDLMKLAEHFSNMQQKQRSFECDDCHSTQVFEKFDTKS